MTSPPIHVEALAKAFDNVPVLRGITATIPAGAMTAIVGPSGCGKSTLLFCLAGLERPTNGRVTVLGHDLSRLSSRALARLYRDRIGFVFQTYNLIPSLSARENVVLSRRLAGGPGPRSSPRMSCLACCCPGGGARMRSEHATCGS